MSISGIDLNPLSLFAFDTGNATCGASDHTDAFQDPPDTHQQNHNNDNQTDDDDDYDDTTTRAEQAFVASLLGITTTSLSSISILMTLSNDATLYTNQSYFDQLIARYNTDDKKKELLLLYETALNITSIGGRLKNWTRGDGVNSKRLTGWNAFLMRHSVEAHISRSLGYRFNFVSIVHFILFMIANNGYKRGHRKGSERKSNWSELPKHTKDGYRIAAAIFRNKIPSNQSV